jgi:hypothetical protein
MEGTAPNNKLQRTRRGQDGASPLNLVFDGRRAIRRRASTRVESSTTSWPAASGCWRDRATHLTETTWILLGMGASVLAWIGYVVFDARRTGRAYGPLRKWRRLENKYKNPASIETYNMGPSRGHSWWWWRRG